MTQAVDGEQQSEVGKEPAAAPTAGAERRWLFARVLSLLLMVAGLLLPWTDIPDLGYQVAYYMAVGFGPLPLVPGMVAFLLVGALLFSDRFSRGVSTGLSLATIVVLCLAFLFGLGVQGLILGMYSGDAGPSWGGLVYLVGVATALVVEIRAFRTMRGND